MSDVSANLLKHSDKDEFGNMVLCFEEHRIKMAFDEQTRPLLCYNDIERACGSKTRQKAGSQWSSFFVHLAYASSNPHSMARYVKLGAVIRILVGKRKANTQAARFLAFLTETLGSKFPADLIRRSDVPNRPNVGFRMVPGQSNLCVGDDGSVWSSRTRQWKQLKQFVNKDGYFSVHLASDVKEYEGFKFSEVMLVHRLILLAFQGLPGEGQVACHFNGVKIDNRPDNLRWDTCKANSADTLRHQKESDDMYAQATKVNAALVREIRDLRSRNASYKAIGRKLGISHSIVRAVALGKTWKHVI